MRRRPTPPPAARSAGDLLPDRGAAGARPGRLPRRPGRLDPHRRGHVVPPREARTFNVPAGHFFRIVCTDGGPQVGDLNLWAAGDLSERFFSGKTRALHGTHLSTGDRLWSCLPYLRPMATITDDTLDWYGVDAFGGARPRRDRHPLRPLHPPAALGRRLPPLLPLEPDPRARRRDRPRRSPEAEPHVHDVLNVFMCTGFTRDDGPLLHEGEPGAARRLPRVLRRDRPPRRALGLPGRRLLRRAFQRRRRLPSARWSRSSARAAPRRAGARRRAAATPRPAPDAARPSPSRIAARRERRRPRAARWSPARRRSRSGRAPAIAARFSASIPAIRSSMSPCRARW